MTKQNKVKTNAMRQLDKHHIAYTIFTYPDTIHSALEVAPLLGVPADHIFKTLVVLADDQNRQFIRQANERNIQNKWYTSPQP